MNEIIPQDAPQKQCTKCFESFPATKEYFYGNKNGKYGVASLCKLCAHIYNMAYAEAHREEHRAYDKQYHLDHLEKKRSYHKLHPEAHRAKVRNYRARARMAEGFHTAEDVKVQYKRQKGTCYYCNVKLGMGKNVYHVDHVVPIVRGGSNGPENIVVTCPSCNLSKQDKLPHEWAQGQRLM